jgi:hypothetical protein
MKYRITAEGVLETGLSGFDLINFPMLNKGLRSLKTSAPSSPCTDCSRRMLAVLKIRRPAVLRCCATLKPISSVMPTSGTCRTRTKPCFTRCSCATSKRCSRSQNVSYNDLGDLYLDKLNTHHVTRNLVRRLERLGYTVTLSPQPTAA